MSGAGLTAYNPDDPLQASFLSALALGETGNDPNASEEGYGGTDLSNVTTDSFGFPISGAQSSAAGIFQFTQSTWDQLAQQSGLNFSNSSDQTEGAWYYAQQIYQQQTGQSLETALQNGDYSSVQSALGSVWPSVFGNGAAPQGLANDLASGIGSSNVSAGTPGAEEAIAASGSPSSSTATGANQTGTGIIADIENFFVRSGLIVAGIIVVGISLWALMKDSGFKKFVSV